MSITRRELIVGSAALAAGSAVTTPFLLPKFHFDHRPKRSSVAVLNAHEYSHDLDQILATALRLFPINVRGKTVVLKPNLVDFIPSNAINTRPLLVLAAAEAFRRMGANSVVVAEGPGHLTRYATGAFTNWLRAKSSRREDSIRRFEPRRIDSHAATRQLHRHEGSLASSHCARRGFPGFDAKDKGSPLVWSPLSMKNMFGVVPGTRYGWPKNILHWKGIQESILDVCATVPIHFVIADGIVAMEGNGPLNGNARSLGKIVLADDPVAADATCARLMGYHSERVSHIHEGSRFLGNALPTLVDQVGGTLDSPAMPFAVVRELRYLQAL